MVVLGDLTHLFGLPTDFAWAPLQGHSGWHWNRRVAAHSYRCLCTATPS
jgi:hypothetical protein